MPEEIMIYETKYWKVILAEDQTYLGRCFVVLKRNCGELSKIRKDEWYDLLTVIKKLENAYKKAFGASLFNWSCLMNGTYKVKNPKPQIHWHLRPRYRHQVKFAGLTFKDLEFGSHYKRRTNRKVPNDISKKITTQIQKYL